MSTDKPKRLDPDAMDEPVFSALITPHRSLGRQGFRMVMTLVCIASVISSLPFVILGAWPVAGFFGLDLLALYVAFRVNFARARSFEEIVLTRIDLFLRKVPHRGASREWHFNPLWTRLVRETDDDFGVLKLALVSRGQSVTIAQEISAAERATLGNALGDALAAVKRG